MSLAYTDAVGRVLSTALDAVSQRQSVIADNLANVNTPHFTATSLDFEDALRSAIADGSIADGQDGVSPTRRLQTGQYDSHGNNVDVRAETLSAVQSQYQYQVLTRAVSDRFERIHESLSGM